MDKFTASSVWPEAREVLGSEASVERADRIVHALQTHGYTAGQIRTLLEALATHEPVHRTPAPNRPGRAPHVPAPCRAV